jgi:demethylmenaquinone methyltransferase/2-methoxy-6-polyprenyl-1,4-benzoquinol methylase
MTTEPSQDDRFRPHAGQAMAEMFDQVTPAYDLLNRLMTLGQDEAWRRAMWRAIPESARSVLDLCTGNGVSLPGLQRTGRLVLGVDVSLGMLEVADAEHGGGGWAPRLACADAFRLPLRDGHLDAVTIAFGMRNLRPRERSLAELARVLRPGGTLAVLEATAPRPGLLAPFHRFHLRHVVPLLGRLSPDPSAYRYLGESILEFGDGREFESALSAAGFGIRSSRSFLLGASRLWVAEKRARRGEIPSGERPALQDARPGSGAGGEMAHPGAGREGEWRAWTAGQLVVSAALVAALVWAGFEYRNVAADLPLQDWQRAAGWLALGVGLALFGLRTVALAALLARGPRRR